MTSLLTQTLTLANHNTEALEILVNLRCTDSSLFMVYICATA